ncbi:MAG: protein translocase subunit SecF [bacterium]
MFIIKNRAIFLSISALLVISALVSVFIYGLNPGSDFRGGAVYEVEYTDTRPADVKAFLPQIDAVAKGATIQVVGEKGAIVKAGDISQVQKDSIANVLSNNGQIKITEKRFSAIGPIVGKELARKGITSIVLVILVIVIFITLAFRHVSHIVSSWKYGVVTIAALLHDIIIPSGFAAYLGHYYNFEADALFLTALLTIMALSVNDTIVIFDRIRENVKNRVGRDFEETVGISLSQTFIRSLITSLTIIVSLVILYLFGAESTKNFALIMAIGIFFGTYSSIFVASPLLVIWSKATTVKVKK